MAIQVVGVYGSPRKGGNSDLLLDSTLRGAREQGAKVNRISVRDLEISGCRECNGCEKTGKCVVQDDMQHIYALLDAADVIVLSSPIFFYGLSSQLKAMIDRGQALWARKRLEGRAANTKGRGYLLAVGATKGEKLFLCAQMVARYFFDACSMTYEGGLFFEGIEGKAEIKQHPDALSQAYDLGMKLGSSA
ncbi:MAG: flavodoxin family protein [Thermodesulfobacteriota bacterium]